MSKCNCKGFPVRGAVCGYIIVNSNQCSAPDSYECYYKIVDKINNSLEKVGNILEDSKESDPEFYNELSEILTPKTKVK